MNFTVFKRVVNLHGNTNSYTYGAEDRVAVPICFDVRNFDYWNWDPSP